MLEQKYSKFLEISHGAKPNFAKIWRHQLFWQNQNKQRSEILSERPLVGCDYTIPWFCLTNFECQHQLSTTQRNVLRFTRPFKTFTKLWSEVRNFRQIIIFAGNHFLNYHWLKSLIANWLICLLETTKKPRNVRLKNV